MTIIHSLLHNTERFVNYDWAINTLSYHIHVFHTYSILTNSAMRYCYFFNYFFHIRKIQDTDDWTLVAVLLRETFFISLIKPETCSFLHQHLWRTRLTKNTRSMCKPKMRKAGDEKVTNRRGRAFIQKIITPFKHYQRIQTCSC